MTILHFEAVGRLFEWEEERRTFHHLVEVSCFFLWEPTAFLALRWDDSPGLIGAHGFRVLL